MTVYAITDTKKGRQGLRLLIFKLPDVTITSQSQVRVLQRLCWKCNCCCFLSRLRNKSSKFYNISSVLILALFSCEQCKGLDTCYSAVYMSQTRDQQRFTVSATLYYLCLYIYNFIHYHSKNKHKINNEVSQCLSSVVI